MPIFSNIFDTHMEPDSMVITFSSDMKNIDRACAESMAFLSENVSCIPFKHFPINLVIREGLTNAVRHGNLNDPEKTVRFSTLLEMQYILFTIEDQGPGFDWKKLDLSFKRPDLETGRGLWIISRYSHEYGFNRRGNILYMKHPIPQKNI